MSIWGRKPSAATKMPVCWSRRIVGLASEHDTFSKASSSRSMLKSKAKQEEQRENRQCEFRRGAARPGRRRWTKFELLRSGERGIWPAAA